MGRRHRREIWAWLVLSMFAVAELPTALGCVPSGLDVKYPETPAGQVLRTLLVAIESGDHEKIEQVVGDLFGPRLLHEFPAGEHAAILSSLAGHRVQDVRSRGPRGAEALLVHPVTEQAQLLSLSVHADPPHRIESIDLDSAPPARDPLVNRISDMELVAELEAFMQRVADADAFSGTVLLAENGIPLFQGAYGLASKRFQVPNKIDTRFNLGSMNKMFTAVAILQLVETGEVLLDDSIGEYLDEEWCSEEIRREVQVQHLLTHTSGLGSYFNRKFMESSRTRFRAVNDYKPLVADEKLAFRPGSQRRYSNTGFLLAGAVIEGATGEDYFDYIRANVYGPAGMVHSDSYEMDRPVPNLAIGYSRDDSGDPPWRNNIYSHVVKGGPAGGGFSTVEDLLAFDTALRSFELLGPETTERLWSAKPELGSPAYGFGMGVHQGPLGRRVGHSGGFDGINSELRMYLDSGITLAVMTNYDRAASMVVDKVERLLAARPAAPAER